MSVSILSVECFYCELLSDTQTLSQDVFVLKLIRVSQPLWLVGDKTSVSWPVWSFVSSVKHFSHFVVHWPHEAPNHLFCFCSYLCLKTLVDCRTCTLLLTSFWFLEATHMLLNTTKNSRRRVHLVSFSFVLFLFLISCVNNICSIYWMSPNIGYLSGVSSAHSTCQVCRPSLDFFLSQLSCRLLLSVSFWCLQMVFVLLRGI